MNHEGDKQRLPGFPNLVRQAFAFLEIAGFSESGQGPTIVRFKRGELECNVYVGRRSGELGFQIGHDDEQFSTSALIRLRDPTLADKYRNLVPADLSELQTGIEKLAALVREFGDRALEDDPRVFADLRRQSQEWSQAYAAEVRAQQIRPKAEAAFREGRYREAIGLYEEIAPKLTPTELKKLSIARRKADAEA